VGGGGLGWQVHAAQDSNVFLLQQSFVRTAKGHPISVCLDTTLFRSARMHARTHVWVCVLTRAHAQVCRGVRQPRRRKQRADRARRLPVRA
jgi:hypothetical protein